MKLKTILKKIPGLQRSYSLILNCLNKRLYKKNPKILANQSYKRTYKHDIAWENPQDFNEKIIWMQFNSDTRLWSRLADKYLVREYVREKGEEKLLNKLYGRYNSAEEIDFDRLPNQFVLKPNNASGKVILVKDKSELDIKKTRKILNKWLKSTFVYNNAELHYARIEPCLIAEEYLEEIGKTRLIDYKFYCFNGIPECIEVVTYRSSRIHYVEMNLYDMKWNLISEHIFYPRGENVSKPKTFNKMVDACLNLAKDIPFVRIDFYEVNGKPYFGEMTFTPGYIFTKEYCEYLGSKLTIKPNNKI